MELKEKILLATLGVFKRKGIVFTMNDVAGEIGISKKTIYTVFKDKEELYIEVVDYFFDMIKKSENDIYNDDTLSTEDKLKNILSIIPEEYKDLDLKNIHLMENKYPKIYDRIKCRLETDWEKTVELIERGIEEGVFREVDIHIFKGMMESTYKTFFESDALIKNKMRYSDVLSQVVDLMMNGIVKKV